MGTRGTMAVRVDGITRGSYNHFDSYYSGLGEDLLAEAKTLTGPMRDIYKQLARQLQEVPEDSKPTPEQIAALAPYTNLGVSNQSTEDWYCLLRETQGSLTKTLKAGYYEPFPVGEEEYSYVIDFDTDTFEVYCGREKTAEFPLDQLPDSLRIINNEPIEAQYYG